MKKLLYFLLILLSITINAKDIDGKKFQYKFVLPVTGENGLVNFEKLSMENAAIATKDFYDLIFFATDRFKNQIAHPAPVYLLQGLFVFLYPSTLSKCMAT